MVTKERSELWVRIIIKRSNNGGKNNFQKMPLRIIEREVSVEVTVNAYRSESQLKNPKDVTFTAH